MEYDLISGLLGGAFGGAFGPSPADSGAAAQQANAEAFRRMHESYRAAPPPTPEQQLEAMRGAQNAWRPTVTWFDLDSARKHAEKLPSVDWLYWGLLVGMALALILRWFLLGGPR